MLEKPQVCWLKYAEKSEKTLKYAGFATSFKRKIEFLKPLELKNRSLVILMRNITENIRIL